LTMAIGNFFVSKDKAVSRENMGHDFLAFYTAGTFVGDGRADQLYNLHSVSSFEHNLARTESLTIGTEFGPYWNPPFLAWVFVPLAHLPYHTAWNVWCFINFACAAAAIWLLMRIMRERSNV